jgi:caffeoyl-CoA O-methyltransferase
MHEKFLSLTQPMYEYLVAHSAPPDDVLRDLAEETAALGPVSMMQVAVEQGAFLTMLARLMGARRAIEICTFTGYSSICIARGLADGGRLLCCDVSEEWTAIARRYWTRAGLDDRIELRLGPGLDTLRALPREPAIDLVFIDADKPGYRDYYEELLPRVRPNGLFVFDNVLWSEAVADPAVQDDNTRALRALAAHVRQDAPVDEVMLAIADGLLLARKR